MFFDTLLDENAASHIALGQALDFGVDDTADRERINRSEIHIDFMIGGDEVAVTGVRPRTATEVPLLRGGRLADLRAAVAAPRLARYARRAPERCRSG